MKSKLLLLILFTSNIFFVNAQIDEMFYYPGKDLKQIEWENYEELVFTVESDTVSGLILKPLLKPKASIIYFHGASGNLTDYISLTLPFVKNNFQVILIDFRGYGKSTGTPTHTNIAIDGQKVFDMLCEREDIKKSTKIIYGISIGTQIAAQLAKNNQEKIHGLILEGAMSSFTEIAMFHTPHYSDFLEKNYISPYAAKEDIKSIDKIAKLIIHSKEDKDVPYVQGILVFDNAPEPKNFLEFSGEHLSAIKYKKEQIIQFINDMTKTTTKE